TRYALTRLPLWRKGLYTSGLCLSFCFVLATWGLALLVASWHNSDNVMGFGPSLSRVAHTEVAIFLELFLAHVLSLFALMGMVVALLMRAAVRRKARQALTIGAVALVACDCLSWALTPFAA